MNIVSEGTAVLKKGDLKGNKGIFKLFQRGEIEHCGRGKESTGVKS